jgi:hypothetical protein
LRDKGRTIAIVYAPPTGDPITDDALDIAHHDCAYSSAARAAGEYFGPTLVIVEPAHRRAPYASPQAGRFYVSARYTIGHDGGVSVSPRVFYWMRFDEKLHLFAHRYDNDRAHYPIEEATREDLVNHALRSIAGFDVYAFAPTRPF